MEPDLDSLVAFLAAAEAGKRGGGCASSGEWAAYCLVRGGRAAQLSSMMQNMDRGLQEGFASLLVVLCNPDSRVVLLPKIPR